MQTDRKWVLVVDDEPEVREIIREQITGALGESVFVVEAQDGVEATSKIGFQTFDCIVTDLKMPKRDGQSFILAVLESQLNATTPIIVVTGHPDPDIEKFVPHLTTLKKPFRPDHIAQLVETQIKLGRTDQRVPVGLLNSLVAAMQKHFESNYNMLLAPLAPSIKKSDTIPEGDIWCYLVVRMGTQKIRFLVAFERMLLAKMTALDALKDEKRLILRIIEMAFSAASGRFREKQYPAPAIQQSSFIEFKNREVFNQIRSAKGVTLCLRADEGRFFIHTIFSDLVLDR